MSALKRRIEQSWYGKRLWWLIPLSGLFALVVVFRRSLYRLNLLSRRRSPVPIVVIGNIVAGGVGKSPLTVYLAQSLSKRGFSPGIVSRGYGVPMEKSEVRMVYADSTADRVGDEPLMMSRLAQVPVCVGPNRHDAIAKLLDEGCDIILADDGLQHYKMKRDLEICVIDQEKQMGNGFSIPAGPLRESIKRLNSVDFIVLRHAGYFDRSAWPHDPIGMTVQSGCLRPLNMASNEAVMPERGQKVRAIAGIAQPDRFFRALQDMDYEVDAIRFDDHHRYSASDFVFSDDLPLVMTEKDAVKCETLALKNAWVLPISTSLDADLDVMIIKALKLKGWNFG